MTCIKSQIAQAYLRQIEAVLFDDVRYLPAPHARAFRTGDRVAVLSDSNAVLKGMVIAVSGSKSTGVVSVSWADQTLQAIPVQDALQTLHVNLADLDVPHHQDQYGYDGRTYVASRRHLALTIQTIKHLGGSTKDLTGMEAAQWADLVATARLKAYVEGLKGEELKDTHAEVSAEPELEFPCIIMGNTPHHVEDAKGLARQVELRAAGTYAIWQPTDTSLVVEQTLAKCGTVVTNK